MSSKNLIESCRQYERYHRNTDKPLMKFAAFNRAHGTSLPENRAEVESKYLKTIQRARQAEGVPVRRRMRSLHSMLNGMEPAKVAPQEPMLVQSKDGVVGIYTGGSSVRRAWTNELCDYNPETFSKATEKDLQEAFMDAVLQQENPKLTSKANMVMHVMPKEESHNLSLKSSLSSCPPPSSHCSRMRRAPVNSRLLQRQKWLSRVSMLMISSKCSRTSRKRRVDPSAFAWTYKVQG